MTAAEKKISAFCTRHRISYEWQALKFNGRRARVESVDRDRHAAILAAARRLKGIRVTDWTCGAGGVWEGRIYLQDVADAERIDAAEAKRVDIASMSKTERLDYWLQACKNGVADGMNPEAATNYADSLYPTPATV